MQRIEEILTPVTGAGAVKAQVTADIDFTITETARESYNPQGRQVRSEQTAEELNSGGAAAGGIPGALSNQPPGVASAPEQAAAAATPPPAAGVASPRWLHRLNWWPAPPPTSSSKRATRNYELDKTVSHIRQQTGTVQRLSVAVVVDDVVVTDRRGRVKRTARTPEELARLTAIVKEAIGFDEKRGDTVNVTNAAFSDAVAGGRRSRNRRCGSRSGWWDLAKQAGGGLLILVLLMMVVRPLLRGLQARSLPVVRRHGR
ncbi:MAG: hypothetical protein MZV65_52025 [Chromatiales bacterium]|nr:hypothetical protein [Chromatiales bacterium]